jgi:hypothetical protein
MVTLALHDDLYLHAHDESGKTLIHRSSIEIGLTGAALIQLWLTARIELVDGVVLVRDPTPIGSPFGDRFLAAMLSLSHAHTPHTWLGWLNEGAYERVGAGLADAGVLTPVRTRRPGARTRYALRDPHVAVQARARTRYAVLGLERPDVPTVALCALVGVLGLENGLYVSLPTAAVAAKLETIGRTVATEIREIVLAVDAMVASASVSLYR